MKEFTPTSRSDPLFKILRDVFEKSFQPHYTEILSQLHLEPGLSLKGWMRKTFDGLQCKLVAKEWRCFTICDQSDLNKIIGLMTTKQEYESDGSLYVAQFCVHPCYKRRGFGSKLLRGLFEFFPSQTKFVGLCRRANRPALQFYLKNGARYCDDPEIAKKWDYPPDLYVGLEFTGTPGVMRYDISKLQI